VSAARFRHRLEYAAVRASGRLPSRSEVVVLASGTALGRIFYYLDARTAA